MIGSNTETPSPAADPEATATSANEGIRDDDALACHRPSSGTTSVMQIPAVIGAGVGAAIFLLGRFFTGARTRSHRPANATRSVKFGVRWNTGGATQLALGDEKWAPRGEMGHEGR